MSDLHDLVAPYALDALDDLEAARFESHLETCAQCREELAGMTQALASVASENETEPPATLKTSVMAALDAEPGETPAAAPTKRHLQWGWVFAGAAAVIAVVFAGLWINSTNQLTEADRALAIYEAPDAVTVALTGDAGEATFVYSPSLGEGVFDGETLQVPAEDLTYQLWLIDEAGPQPAGTFRPEESTVVLVDGIASGQTIAMTVEPSGGVPLPTGDVVFSAEL